MNKYAKYMLLKSSIENLFGSEAWYALKETNNITVWRKYIIKTLQALKVSLHQSVKIYDQEWIDSIDKDINYGLNQAKNAKEIDELIALLAGTLINVSFQQIGFMPRRKGKEKVSLRKENWDLTQFRSVLYIQDKQQKDSVFWSNQQKAIGFDKQIDLHFEYNSSNTKLS